MNVTDFFLYKSWNLNALKFAEFNLFVYYHLYVYWKWINEEISCDTSIFEMEMWKLVSESLAEGNSRKASFKKFNLRNVGSYAENGVLT